MAMEELDDDENISAGNHWILPSAQFEGLWESLVYEEDVKQHVNI
jgi:pachytene checkpoint protein 2